MGVGNTLIWAAERDGSLVVRDSTSSKTIERLVSGHDWERILCIEPVGSGPGGTVWCGTEAGPILVFDRNRKLQLQARQHSGGVHASAPRRRPAATALSSLAARIGVSTCGIWTAR